ncbi:MAG: methyltransferase domain-containing protein [Gemmatimonadales bacterium]
MDESAYRMMAADERRHWWWCGRRAILGRVLNDLFAAGVAPRGTLYDLGCGVGANLGLLERFGPAVGYDSADAAVVLAHSLGRANVHKADLALGEEALPAEQPPGRVVLLADVLEHLNDERPALALAARLLLPGGILLATVPALPWLRGQADEFTHDRRRYTRGSLVAAIEPRFRIRRVTYFNSLLLGPIAAVRLLSRILRLPGAEEAKLPSRPVNALLKLIFEAEAPLLARADLPIGVSLLCVAEKP